MINNDFVVSKERAFNIAKYAFVFGNEVFGVNDYWIEAASGSLEIPQFGTKHSLNVSVTMGVVAWDFVSKSQI